MKINIIASFITVCLLPLSAFSANYGEMTVSRVSSIYDGDTFRAYIDSEHPIIGNNISIRVKGIDTPEIKSSCLKEKQLARKAKEMTVYMLRGANNIELKNIDRGKYFRILADVEVDGISLAKTLLDNNLAVKYDGGKKTHDWCN